MKKFTEICSGHYFVIPENQRGFSWSKDEVNDVFNDLELAGTQSHYMGPIIVTRTLTPDFQDDTLTTTAEFTLEDGQQRLTTFFIIINELKKGCAAIGLQLEAQEIERIIFYQKGGLQLRLKNNNLHLEASLSHIISGAPPMPANPTPPIMALKSVADYVAQRVGSMSQQELLTWKHRLTNQAKFIWVDLAAEGVNRYLTFDAINSRGLPLSEFDKIKNFCILVNQVRTLNTAPEDSWYKAITQLEKYGVSSRSEEAAYISDLYNVFHDENISQENVHTTFVKKYRKLLTAPDSALENDFRDFVSLWEKYAESFGFVSTRNRTIYYGNMCTAKAGNWLDRLDNLELPTITRVLLTSCHYRMSNQTDFEKVARACEIYTFRVYAVLRYRKDNNAKNIIKLANEVLRLNKDYNHVINRMCTWLQTLAPLKEVISKLANTEPKYYFDPLVKGWQHCYYFLYEYELGCSPQGVSPIPWARNKADKINTQEHILPQSHRGGSWWQSHWPNADEAEKFKHRLGNLVLTANNSVLGRKSFPLKLNDQNAVHDFSHQNATNSEKRINLFTNGTDWKIDNIMKREVEMFEFAVKRWSIPCCFDNALIDLEHHKDANGNPISIAVSHTECFQEVDDSDDLGFEGQNVEDVNDIQI